MIVITDSDLNENTSQDTEFLQRDNNYSKLSKASFSITKTKIHLEDEERNVNNVSSIWMHSRTSTVKKMQTENRVYADLLQLPEREKQTIYCGEHQIIYRNK